MTSKTALGQAIIEQAQALAQQIAQLELEEAVSVLNAVRLALHEVSPFRSEPVDCVLWEPAEEVVENEYNPNVVADPEMELLRVSIDADGYTQPIVVFPQPADQGVDGAHAAGRTRKVVVDGAHRRQVGTSDLIIQQRVKGYLPTTRIRSTRGSYEDRVAATVRHNRAKGRSLVVEMSRIVLDLTRRGWSSERIQKELGMSADEVLRLQQITGLAEAFKNEEFSMAWEIGEGQD